MWQSKHLWTTVVDQNYVRWKLISTLEDEAICCLETSEPITQ